MIIFINSSFEITHDKSSCKIIEINHPYQVFGTFFWTRKSVLGEFDEKIHKPHPFRRPSPIPISNKQIECQGAKSGRKEQKFSTC